jgi:hypothetical protein
MVLLFEPLAKPQVAPLIVIHNNERNYNMIGGFRLRSTHPTIPLMYNDEGCTWGKFNNFARASFYL